MTNDLKKFIKEQLGYEVKDINHSFDKTGVDGLDAEIFFKNFSEYFEVDISNFDFSRYFNGGNFLKNIIKYWGKKKSFTFGHLVDVVDSKEWFDPY